MMLCRHGRSGAMRGGMLLSVALTSAGARTGRGRRLHQPRRAHHVEVRRVAGPNSADGGVGPNSADVASVVIVQAELLRFQNGLGAFLMIVACGSPHHPRAHISLRIAHACTGHDARMHTRNAAHPVKRDSARGLCAVHLTNNASCNT